ncbi:MAG: hypothetical protein HIU88_12505 [Acidobacteria bacterium]|nr:hypothetical protein [Acidobacteriota bacterium]
MIGFIIWTSFLAVMIAANVLYFSVWRNRRVNQAPSVKQSANARIVLAVVGVVIALTGILTLIGR